MKKLLTFTISIFLLFFLPACSELGMEDRVSNSIALNKFQDLGNNFSSAIKNLKISKSGDAVDVGARKLRPLEGLVGTQSLEIDLDQGYKVSLNNAVENDPFIRSLEQDLKAMRLEISALKTERDFQVSGAIYGGVEDVSERTNGVAMVLNAKRLLYDGGTLDARIRSLMLSVASKEQELNAEKNKKAMYLASLWVDLERFRKLDQRMQSRLLILDPLISQLERVAEAGIGDVSKVATAQRTVSQIRVTQQKIVENLNSTELAFENSFGSLPVGEAVDSEFIAKLVPTEISVDMIRRSPSILAHYYAYQALESDLAAVNAKDSFVLGFEARSTTPLGSSTTDSEESIGLVLNKTLINGDRYSLEAEQIEFRINGMISQIENTFKEVNSIISAKMQTISSTEKAIALSKRNAELTEDEILYLRKQLVIGGSTLDSVLSAEARLYNHESEEINFYAEKLKSELAISAALGVLSTSLNL